LNQPGGSGLEVIMKNIAICLGILLLLTGRPVAQEHATLDKDAHQITAQELQEALGKDKKIMVIDVRSPQEFATGHIPGAVNIPIEDLARKLEDLKVPKDTTLVTMCEHGGRSSRAAVEMGKLGYKTTSFCTLDSWKKGGYKIESDKPRAEKTESAKPPSETPVYKFVCHHYCNGDKRTTDLEQHCDCACNQPFRECMKGS
jgi:rhodanese-related sulfurtransferase